MARGRRRDRAPNRNFWWKFEVEVERAVVALGNATVERDVQVKAALSGRLRQIDVLAVGEVAGCRTTVVFEAKCYTGRVQIGTVDELVGKALDLAAQHAVLYAPNGFSEGAYARAKGTKGSPLQIGLVELSPSLEQHQNAWAVERSPGGDTLGPIVMSVTRIVSPAQEDDYGRFLRGETPLRLDL
ncbi:restriction endonuclease [Streptomyces olivaceus]|uniref:restriction endonuclease n=1 Tax=Streptomyces olivaceus TaxID=47716 RepID=UPI003647945D